MSEQYVWGERALRQQRYLNDNTRAFIAERPQSDPVQLPYASVVVAVETVLNGQAGQFRVLQGPTAQPNSSNPEAIRAWNLIMDQSFPAGQWGLATPVVRPGTEELIWVAWRVPEGARGQEQDCADCDSGKMPDTISVGISNARSFDPEADALVTRMNSVHPLTYLLDPRFEHPVSQNKCTRRAYFEFGRNASDVFSDDSGDDYFWRMALDLSIQQDGGGNYFWRFRMDYGNRDLGISALQIFDSAADPSKPDCEATASLTLTSQTFTAPLDFGLATIEVNP